MSKLLGLLRGVAGHDGQDGPDPLPVGDGIRPAEGITTMRLNPLVKRHVLPSLPGLADGVRVGWAQFPQSRGRGFSLVLFTGRDRCVPLALADDRGHVYFSGRTDPSEVSSPPVLMFAREREITVPKARLNGERHAEPGDGTVSAIYGNIIAIGVDGSPIWLASWLKRGNRYTLEQLRPDLPASLRAGLEYRDALAVAYFCAYLGPRLQGALTGFGSGNIYHRLHFEAPIGAIRRCVRDTVGARAHGLRVSGLEDFFVELMNEAGALDEHDNLKAVHGEEPLRLHRSPNSGTYMFGWDSGLDFGDALTALRIEGNLNRFAAVGRWLERNSRLGLYPTEDTVTRAEAAQIDHALLLDPALMAMPEAGLSDPSFDPVHDDATGALPALVDMARRAAADMARSHPDPRTADTADAVDSAADAPAGESGSAAEPADAGGSEWVYRQTVTKLLSELRLPYRFDVELRSNLADGQVAIGFTTAGMSMMPVSVYDTDTRDWKTLTKGQRASMSADYNLRVGLMMAAFAFGADQRVESVSLHLDSLGLEEAIDEQNIVIADMLNRTLSAFERMRSGGGVVPSSDKGAPKDGDVHGNPEQLPTGIDGGVDGVLDVETDQDQNQGQAQGQDGEQGQDDVNSTFEDMMNGVEFDETLFAAAADPQATPADDPQAASLYDSPPSADESEDPMEALRKNPTIRALVTVTFTRERFLHVIGRFGMSRPRDVYRMFDASMAFGDDGGLVPSAPLFTLSDHAYAPAGAQDGPELSDRRFDPATAAVLGTDDSLGLSIQRADVLQHAVGDFHLLAQDATLDSVTKAQRAMDLIGRIGDPELTEHASDVTSALIDGRDTPELGLTLSRRLNTQRTQARDLLFTGQFQKAVDAGQRTTDEFDRLFAGVNGVPRYFNSYAERVLYNRMFATPGETTVLIPDNLFYTHLELADFLAQMGHMDDALKHLNAMVSYAPVYPLPHLRLAVQMSRMQDWDSVRAACLNAVLVAIDRNDAAYAYYRLAYAEWMRDEFDVAAAAYLLSADIRSVDMMPVDRELEELDSRARRQCIPVPRTVEQAREVFRSHGLPVWPDTEAVRIVGGAARVCVDSGLFVPARTLSTADARINNGNSNDLDAAQLYFLRSLRA